MQPVHSHFALNNLRRTLADVLSCLDSLALLPTVVALLNQSDLVALFSAHMEVERNPLCSPVFYGRVASLELLLYEGVEIAATGFLFLIG